MYIYVTELSNAHAYWGYHPAGVRRGSSTNTVEFIIISTALCPNLNRTFRARHLCLCSHVSKVPSCHAMPVPKHWTAASAASLNGCMDPRSSSDGRTDAKSSLLLPSLDRLLARPLRVSFLPCLVLHRQLGANEARSELARRSFSLLRRRGTVDDGRGRSLANGRARGRVGRPEAVYLRSLIIPGRRGVGVRRRRADGEEETQVALPPPRNRHSIGAARRCQATRRPSRAGRVPRSRAERARNAK